MRIGCTQTGRSCAAIRWNTGRNFGADSGSPATLVNTWTPRAPSSFTARSASATDASTLFIGSDAMKVGK